MLNSKRILAVVPARSGSKGVPNKNIRPLGGISLIGHAGKALARLPWIDRAIISTDSLDYVREAELHGLSAPFVRPATLSGDRAGAVETMQHALAQCEHADRMTYDVILIIQPTSPLRKPEDVQGATELLISENADSVVSVSPVDDKSHPSMILSIHGKHLSFWQEGGAKITSRQLLDSQYYYRNGYVYALTRQCLMDYNTIFTTNTLPFIIDRPVANIDTPLDFAWAEFLLSHPEFNA